MRDFGPYVWREGGTTTILGKPNAVRAIKRKLLAARRQRKGKRK